jgi:ABC-type cobalamin/Fe3+-siderophores transport system ATPase subunit
MLNTLVTAHNYPGKLFVVEGIDGSGKTTQLGLLAKWLAAAGHRVFVTEWNSSALVKAATKQGKKKNALTPRCAGTALSRPDFACSTPRSPSTASRMNCAAKLASFWARARASRVSE